MAVGKAQAASALTTVNFILQVGCTAPTSVTDPVTGATTTDSSSVELKYVSFKYTKNVPAQAPNGTLLGGNVLENRSLTVPFLAILPIPNLEVLSGSPYSLALLLLILVLCHI